jgi:PAS domain S-box-containing protein
VWRELQLILEQFGAGGGGDPANNAVRFLLALYFWAGLGAISLQQYRRLGERRDWFIALAAAVGAAREATMFLLEYGAWRGWFPAPLSFRVFPPLEHALTDVGRVLLGFAYLRYFLPAKDAGLAYLRAGLGVFAGLYVVTAPLWVRFLDANPGLVETGSAYFGLFWGDFAFRLAGALFMAVALAQLAGAARAGRAIPLQVFAGLTFLFLDEFLMLVSLTLGDAAHRTQFGPIRHNFGIWAVPLFIWAYWEELLRRLRDEKARSDGMLESVHESEERYRTLVQNIDHAITLIDPQFRIVMANPAHARLLKKGAADAVGRQCYAAVHGRDAVCPDCPGAVALQTGRKAVVEKTVTRPDGTTVSVRNQCFPVLGPDGKARGFIELVENTTETRKAEAERKRLEERVLQAQKMESLGILAGGIAHDFNNLLMGILGNTDLALAKTTPESPVRPFLNSVARAAQRAADLTNQMLAYSGKGRFVVEPINLSRIVEEMGHLLATVVSKHATLRYRLSPDLAPVEADATQIRQVAMNLITNASDALCDREGVITLSTGAVDADAAYLGSLYLADPLPAGRYVYLEVSDTGAGMDAATQARIFDPFFTTKHTGRGLGLAAVLGIVRGHRGAVKVYSEPGQGTTIKVLFPALADAVQPVAGAPAVPAARPEVPAGERGTVLVVDDEETVRETARAMLESAGYAVLTAVDGVDGLEVLRSHPGGVAAIILDLTMPRMGGEEAFREIRRIDESVPVILSSGFNEQDTVNHFTGKGLAGFMQKPYRMKVLEEKLRAALAARRP